MGTLGNLPLASAHGRCTAAALSCNQWKAHHKFHVPHMIIEYLQLQSLDLVASAISGIFRIVTNVQSLETKVNHS